MVHRGLGRAPQGIYSLHSPYTMCILLGIPLSQLLHINAVAEVVLLHDREDPGSIPLLQLLLLMSAYHVNISPELLIKAFFLCLP